MAKTTGGLQHIEIQLHCAAMSIIHRTIHRRLLPAILAVACSFALAMPAAANEDVQAVDQHSFIQRYTNTAQDLILKGLEMVGVQYRRGGTNPDAGLDCSGFVQLVFQEAAGLVLPRTSREMSEVGTRVDNKKELAPGDLVFFNTMRRAFSHVGIYLGEGRFLHSPRPGGEVRVEEMGSSYWVKRYNGARRIVER